MSISLTYAQTKNLQNVVKSSPFHDDNGVEVIALYSNFMRHFFRSIKPSPKDEVPAYYISHITNYIRDNEVSCGIRNYTLTKEENLMLRKCFEKNKGRGYNRVAPIILTTLDTAEKLDVKSAIRNICEYVKNNTTNKYVVANISRFPITFGNKRSKVYDFLNEYNYNEYIVEESKLHNEGLEEIISTKINNSENGIQEKETSLLSLDKFVFDDNMTFKQMNEVFTFINNAIRFFDEQNINWRKKIKFNTTYIDDTCGYPIVKDIDDIPSPFPEEIEGDEKLANL